MRGAFRSAHGSGLGKTCREFLAIKLGSDHLLAIGSVAERMLILLDIEKLMTSAEMGLIFSTVQ